MTSKYIQEGEILNYAAATAVTVNSVVKSGKLLGVALANIAAGTTGSVLLEGVFEVPKAAATAFTQGGPVLWDDVAKNFKTGDGGACAIAFEAAAASDTTCKVLFTGVPGL